MNRQPTPANILDNILTTDVAPDRTALRSRLRWDYAQVAPVDRKAVEDAAVDILANGQRVQQVMQQSSVAIGERLLVVKRLLEHGQFSDWCDTEFGMSQRTAQNLMNIGRTFDGTSAEISFLTDSVLALLAAPSTPEPARQQAIDEAQAAGKSPSVQRTKEIIAEHKPQPARPSAITHQQSPISNPAPPIDAPLPAWAQEEPVNAYHAFPVPDGRVAAARSLMALYGAAIDSEEQYGELTGRFSDTLGVKRDLTNMIAHLADLIAAIEHPEEVTPDA